MREHQLYHGETETNTGKSWILGRGNQGHAVPNALLHRIHMEPIVPSLTLAQPTFPHLEMFSLQTARVADVCVSLTRQGKAGTNNYNYVVGPLG